MTAFTDPVYWWHTCKTTNNRKRKYAMNRAPVHFAIKIVFATLFIIWLLAAIDKVSAEEEYAVPNSGSPYTNLKDVEVGGIVHIPTGVQVTQDQMVEMASHSRVIYIGETHDNLEAHRAQLETIQKLAQKFPGKVAVGMEMFRRSAQPDLGRWSRGELPVKEFKKLFHNNWGPGFAVYRPIFDFAREHSIPLLGLKSSRETEAEFRKEESAGSQDLFPELDETDPYHKAYSLSVFGGHEDHAEALAKPYRMLLLWEETMAQTVAEFLQNENFSDWKLVVLAGGFHVQYGFGIPKRAFRRVPHAYSIILPTVTELPAELKDREMDVKHISIPLYSADFAWKLEYKVLPEGKVRLGVQLKEEESGVSVQAVGKSSNAGRAGIQAGDILLALNGEAIDDVEDLIERLKTFDFGDRAAIQFRRGGETREVEVVFAEPSP